MSEYDDDFDVEHELGELDEDSVEAKVWQLLALINPGDEETALLQFNDYREAVADVDAEDIESMAVIGRVIDWRLASDPALARSLLDSVPEGWLHFAGE